MDEYSSSVDRPAHYRNRFDNTSFIKSLSRDNSDGPSSKRGSGTSSNGSSGMSGNSNHHHHSIQEMIKHFGKKVHIWPRGKNHHDSSHNLTTLGAQNDPQADFRTRSKSLDVKPTKKVQDWGKTYKIYDSIVKEGRPFVDEQRMLMNWFE